MIKEIKYNGYTATPSDYECPDGDLAGMMNIVPDNGDLKPVLPPTEVLHLDAPNKVIYIHKTTNFTHYIIQNPDNGNVYWVDDKNKNPTLGDKNRLGYYYKINSVNAIGNTLMIFTNNSINYYLWKSSNYISLGDHVPNIEISFGLRGKPRIYSMSDESKKTFTINFNGINENSLYEVWSEENQTKITSQIMAKVNKFLADQTIRKGRFALPFFVRYALRLYDGSLVGHSAPILMNPSTKPAPVVFWKRAKGKGSYTEAECDIMLVSANLDYQLLADSSYDYSKLDEWSDIIKSVDVFISKPIYTYDQNGNCKSFADNDNFTTKFIGALDVDHFANSRAEDTVLLPLTVDSTAFSTSTAGGRENALGKKYVEWKYTQLYVMYFSSDRSYPATSINLPEYSDDKNRENLKDVSQFYFLHSIKLADLPTQKRTDIIVDDEYLQSLVAREVMTDDYLSRDRLIAGSSQTYNNRLNLTSLKRELYNGYMPSAMLAYCNNRTPSWSVSGSTLKLGFGILAYCQLSVTVYIKENGEVYGVNASDNYSYLNCFLSNTIYPSQADADAGTNGQLQPLSWGCFLFYPNVNAFMMRISNYSGTYEVELKPHDFLNGAYAVLDYELQRKSNTTTTPSITHQNDRLVDIPNKIYTSDVNNPFRFAVTNINTVGTGRILGIATAAKALSQGQFGQFPLYAFTTDGVWAMEVSTSTGSYSARQPITRDVCINPDSITQIDSAVLFATDRGIMLISGSESQCISDVLNGDKTFNPLSLPAGEELIKQAGFTTEQLNYIPFMDYLKNCGMLYDYTHQRIIVYNPNCKYAYVYSLKDKAWGMMPSNIEAGLNSYPEALAMTNDGSLINLSDNNISNEDVLKGTKGLVFTRPFKLDAPDLLKTIDTIIQRGYVRKGHVQQVLYGSRDLFNWHAIWSSSDVYLRGFRGTPYKYFRLALLCQLDAEESLYGFTCQFQPRLINQLR